MCFVFAFRSGLNFVFTKARQKFNHTIKHDQVNDVSSRMINYDYLFHIQFSHYNFIYL